MFRYKENFFSLCFYLLLFTFIKSNEIYQKKTVNLKDFQIISNKELKNKCKIEDFYTKLNNSNLKNQQINKLYEGKYIKQQILKEELISYKIQLTDKTNIKKIFIDVLTYTGDIELIIDYPQNLNVSQYNAINKIYLSVKLDKNKENFDYIIFSIKGLDNSFYIVQYNIGKSDKEDSLITNKLEKGIFYLVTINPTKKSKYNDNNKIVKFNNENYNKKNLILISFSSLNCKVIVTNKQTNGNNTIFQYLLQDIINPNLEEGNYSGILEFGISIIEKDFSEYEGNLCKLYTSAIELTDEYNETNYILIPDNIPQQIIFINKIKHVTYGYVHVNYENDIIMKFNLKHKAQYKIILYYNNQKREIEETIVANDIIYLESKEWIDKCKINKKCYILIDIILKKQFIEDPVLEFSIASKGSDSVSYITKNLLRIDYTQNMNSQYFYTELGENEEGYIVLNFLRGSGKIYARIVEEISDEKYGSWRGKYFLPNLDNTMTMDNFKQKVDFSTSNKNCTKGCYLLINVFSNVEIMTFDIIWNYPFSLIVHSYSIDANYNEIPIINIPIEQYVVGTIKEMFPRDSIFEFYSVCLNSDAEQVIIDFQSNSGFLFINVGYKRPKSINKADFVFWSQGKDSLYSIKKNEIFNKTDEYKYYTSLKDIILTIGVWTNISDSIDTTPFAFIIRLENVTENDIYRVNSDQKTICKTKKIKENNKFRCLYVIEYDYISKDNRIMIYPTVQNKSAILDIYSKKINQLDYETNNVTNLKKLIPTKENNDNSEDFLNNNILVVRSGLHDKEYLFVSIETNIETTIELLSTVFVFQDGFYVNPRTPQLFMGLENKEIHLNFPSKYMEMVNIKGIYGRAQIYWENNPENKYYLRGRDDRLSITSDTKKERHILNIIPQIDSLNNDYVFIFKIDYDIRKDNFNFDQLILDSSSNYVYTENDLPIRYYAPVNSSNMEKNEYYEISFTFDILENEDKIETYTKEVPFNVTAFIVKEISILKAKSNPDISIQTDKPIYGNYDPTLKTGLIRISKEDIIKSDIPQYSNPYLYLTIKKQGDNIKKKLYKRISLEMTSIRSKPEIFVSELSYQFGKLEKKETEKKYRLRVDNSFNYMNIKFSCANDELSIKIEGNSNLKKEKEEYGRTIYSIQIKPEDIFLILIIKRNNDIIESEELFMFQYTHSNKTYNKEYWLSNSEIEVEKKTLNITNANYYISLIPVNNYQNYNITYIIRVFDKSKKKPKKAELSLQFDNNLYIKEFYNPKVDKKKIIFEFFDIPDNIEYIQVIAQIRDKEKIEYLSYDLVTSDKINKVDYRYLVLFILFGAFLLIIIVGLIIVVIIFYNKNKGLIDKVKNVSFSLDIGNEYDDENKLIINSTGDRLI